MEWKRVGWATGVCEVGLLAPVDTRVVKHMVTVWQLHHKALLLLLVCTVVPPTDGAATLSRMGSLFGI
jgi:hypothetical protein